MGRVGLSAPGDGGLAFLVEPGRLTYSCPGGGASPGNKKDS